MNSPVCLELICSSGDRVIFPRQACYLVTLAKLACLAVSNVGCVTDVFLPAKERVKKERVERHQQPKGGEAVHSRNTVAVSLISYLTLPRV